jgi:hypothetical protein
VALEARIVRVDGQLAEPRAKRLLVFDRQVLVAEEDDLVSDERVVNPLERVRVQWPVEVNAANLGADRGRQRMDGDPGHGACIVRVMRD